MKPDGPGRAGAPVADFTQQLRRRPLRDAAVYATAGAAVLALHAGVAAWAMQARPEPWPTPRRPPPP